MTLLERVLNKPRTLFLRRALFQIHLWTGIFIGIYAVLIGVSGSILVFGEELRESAVSQWHHVPVPANPRYASPDDWMASIRKSAGAGGNVNLVLPVQPGETVKVSIYRGATGTNLFLNPYTSEVIGMKSNDGGSLRLIDRFHSNLLIPRSGRLLNGIGAVILLLLAFTGIIIWWPGRRLFSRRLKIDFAASWKRINFDLHHAIGFWCLAAFSILSLTGAWFTWPQFFRDSVGRFYPVTPNQRILVDRPDGAGRLPLSELLAVAEATAPGRPVTQVNLPSGPRDPARFNKPGDGKPFHRTATVIAINPYTKQVIRVDSLDTKAQGDRILSWMGPLHTGNFGGLAIKIIWAILGLTMPALFISGFIMWWQRVVKGKWLARRPARERTKEAAQAVA